FSYLSIYFFSNAPATTEISLLSLHDALPISETALRRRGASCVGRCRLGRSAQLDSVQVTPSYRYRRTWLLLGWGMVAAVVVLSLIPLDVDLGGNRDKLAHFAAYGGLSFWFGMLIEGRGRELRIAV